MSPSDTIERVEVYPLNVALKAPFTIASARIDAVRNVAIAVHLSGGCAGWGEIPTLPPVTHEDQQTALNAAHREVGHLTGRRVREWRRLAAEMAERIPRLGSVRAGFEMGILDALARSSGLSLGTWFGGASWNLVTDITIPICPNEQAERLVREYRQLGFDVIKVKVGCDIGEDIARLTAIRRGHPDCRLVLDANGGYSADDALSVLVELRRAGVQPALLEQPVAREDWDGLGPSGSRRWRAGGGG